MKTYQLIHVSLELGARSIIITEEDLRNDPTVSQEDLNTALNIDVDQRMLVKYGANPVKTGNLIRLS